MAQQTNYTGMNGVPQTTYGYSYTGQSNNTAFNSWPAQNPYNQPQPQYQQPQQPQQVESQRVWVQGESSAKAFIVKNNTEQVLWDAEQPVIYIKTVDITGKPSTLTLDYTIRNPRPADDQNETAALKSEIAELKDMMKQLMNQRTNYKPNYKSKGGEEQ